MGLPSFRMVCNGVMALSVGGFAGWLYTAHPADVAHASAKLMNFVGPIVTPRAKDPAATVASKTEPTAAAPASTVAAPSAKSATPAPVTQPVKAATPVAKPRAPKPAAAPSGNPKTAVAPKKNRRAASDE
jgi:hypothetical protein